MESAENHHPDRVGPFLRFKWLLGPLVLFLLIVGFYWKLVLSDQYTWLAGNDTAYQILPWLQFQAGEWRAGRIALWDPNTWCGQPLIGQAQPGVAYPFNWLLLAQRLDGGWLRQSVLHWYFVLIHFMGALFCYWLCRDLKRSRLAAIVGGVVFGLSGYMGTSDWPQMMNGAVWAPLVLLFLFRAERGEKPAVSSAAAGAFLGVSWLSGHHQIPLFITLTSCSLWLWLIFRKGRPNWPVARYCAIFLVFVVLVSAFQVLPMIEYGRLATRWVGTPDPIQWSDKIPYYIHSRYSLPGSGLLAVVLPFDESIDPFMGIVAFALAAMAVFHLWSHLYVRVLTIIGLGGLLFALGANNAFHGVLYALLPMVEKARSPSHSILIFNFCFAVLTAFGIEVLQDKESSGRRVAKLVAQLGAVLLLMNVYAKLTRPPLPDDRVIFSGFVALLFAGILAWFSLGRIRARTMQIGTLALILFELSLVSASRFPGPSNKDTYANVKLLSQHTDIAEFLRQQRKPFRIEVDTEAIPYNFGDWYGIEDAAGYLASVTNNMFMHDGLNPRVRNMMGVAYSVTKAASKPGWTEVYNSSATGLKVFANPAVFPRAWTVHDVVEAKDETELKQYVQWDGFDLRHRVVFRSPAPQVEACPGEERATILVHQSNRVEIGADMACKGLVILADSWYPGWKADIDGQPAQLLEAYGFIRGVVVPAGLHKITMVYRPNSVLIGAGMSLAGVLGLAFLALLNWRKSRRVH